MRSPDAPNVPTILVVDDEPIVRGVVMTLLGGWGFRVHEAETAGEGLAVLMSLAEARPQLVIIDIVLPGDNGVELARQIRDEFPDQRILFISGYSKEVLWSEGLREGEEFLPKPFTAEQLLRAVEAVLSRSKGSGAERAS